MLSLAARSRALGAVLRLPLAATVLSLPGFAQVTMLASVSSSGVPANWHSN